MAGFRKKREKMGGLVRFGEGVALLDMVARSGYEFRAPPIDVQELELPPTCTLPILAWNSASGAMCYDSMMSALNGVYANAKFDECTGSVLAVSHNWLVVSFFVYHHQHPMRAALPASVLRAVEMFAKALSNPKVDVCFPSAAFQPKRVVAFDPLRSRNSKNRQLPPSGCDSLHHQGQRVGSAVPMVKSSRPTAAKSTARPSISKAAKRAAALKAPVSTRVARSLYDTKEFCATCCKINALRLNTNIRMWTLPDIARRFGADHGYAKAWEAVAKNMTIHVIAGLAVSNVTAAAVRRTTMRRTGSLARGTAVYVMLNHIRKHRGGILKNVVSTLYADRMSTAAGVLACYATRPTLENVNGQLAAMLRDDATAMTLAETGRFKFPKMLPKSVVTDATGNGISQQWWWCAIGYRNGPKPTLTTRFIAVPNRHDDEGSYTFVSSEMWTVLDAIRNGWKVNIGLAPTLDTKQLRPTPGSNGRAPIHAAYEQTSVSAPFPEVLCGEYASWWTLLREMENRKIVANSADPSKWAPLDLTGNWMAADRGVSLTVPGWTPPLAVNHGYCFSTLCRLAVVFRFSNFKIDLSPYADFAAYPQAFREEVQADAQEHRKQIAVITSETTGGVARAYDKDGASSAERILQDVCSRE